MTNGPEPTFTTLLDWVEGRIDAPESQHVEDYVAASTDAQATVDWIRDYLRSSSLMPLARPPQELHDRLRDIFEERLGPWAPASYVDGHLDFDSRQQAAAGIRGGEDTTFHLRFATEVLEVLLAVTPSSTDVVDVQGSVRSVRSGEQVDHKDTPLGRDVVFTSARQVRRHAVCDGNGEFRVTGLDVDVDEIWVGLVDSAEQTRVEVDLHQQTI